MNIKDLKPTDYSRVDSAPAGGANIANLPKDSYSKVGTGDGLLIDAWKGMIGNSVGAGRWAGQALFGVGKDIVTPMMQVGATAGGGLLMVAGKAMGKSDQQINAAIDKTTANTDPSMRPLTNMPAFLGGLLDAGSWLIAPETGGGSVVAEQAAKQGVKKFVTGGLGKFAAAQGGAAALKAKGEGSPNAQAAEQGVGAYIGNLAFMGIASKGGKPLGAWAKMLSSTKAGQILAGRVTEAMDALHSGVNPEIIKSNAKTFVTAINAASENLAKGLSEFYNEMSTRLLNQYDPKGMQSLISDFYTNLKPTRTDIGKNFGKVFDYTMKAGDPAAAEFKKFMEGIGAKAEGMQTKAVGDLTQQITDLQATMKASGKPVSDIHAAIQQLIAQNSKSARSPSLAPGLVDYIDEITTRVLNPLNSGRDLSAKVLDDFIHFIQPNGTTAEKAVGKQIQDALYNMFGDSMKANEPATYKVWADAREAFRNLGNTLDQKWAGLIHDMNHPQQFADEIINGNYFKTPADTKEMLKLFGSANHQEMQDAIMRRLFEIAQSTHSAVIGSGSPEALTGAGKAVAKVFDDFLLKVEKASDSEVRLVDASRTHFLQNARNTLSGDLWSLAQYGGKEIGMEASKMESLYGILVRSSPLIETALKNPSELAGKISKMSVEDIQAIKALHTPEQWSMVGANVLRNIAEKSKSIFSKGFTTDSANKFIDMIDKIGGDNRSQVFDALFGDQPEVRNGLEEMVSSLDKIQALTDKTGSVVRGIGHGVAAFIFGVMRHPILATGEARKSLSQFANMSQKDIEEELTAQLEKAGKLSPSVFKQVVTALSTSATMLKVGGRAVGEGVQSLLKGQENQ